MNVHDFTFDHYGRLLDAALDNGCTFYTLHDYITQSDPDSPYTVVRHDVDRKVGTARSIAYLSVDTGNDDADIPSYVSDTG